MVLPFDAANGRFIIFSDQHKGAGDGADDFRNCEGNYIAALRQYNLQEFFLVCLGDSEELWENSLSAVKKHNTENFRCEQAFVRRDAFLKIFGNHDLFWDNDPFAAFHLKNIYGQTVPIYEGLVLQTSWRGEVVRIFCTHGHQGDAQSDGNWFSKFFVARVWAPLQSYLRINPNTPAYDASLKTEHNHIMHEWSADKEKMLLVTGHTHQPVFESLTHLERLYREWDRARRRQDHQHAAHLEREIRMRQKKHEDPGDRYHSVRPTYFNSGCCCFSDGDITGIEIEHGTIRLVKWHTTAESGPARVVLEEASFEALFGERASPDNISQ